MGEHNAGQRWTDLRFKLIAEQNDESNPKCASCGMRQRPENLHEGGLCAGCADEKTFRQTGCFFGQPGICTPGHHPDCWEARVAR